MSHSFYKILDIHGIEMPDHYTGRRRNYEEAKKMVDYLNKNGEHRPYTMVDINENNGAQQTAFDWLIEQLQAPCRGIPYHIIEQAKQMEKEQCEQDYNSGLFDGTMDDVKDRLYKNAEQYYNETYK